MTKYIVLLFSLAGVISCSTIPDNEGINKRALVIGNSNYAISPLANPKNDAMDISKSLFDLGYDVTTLYDQNLQQTKAAVNDFYRNNVKPNTQAIFYYAGHAVQHEGQNLLIPVGEDVEGAASLLDISYPVHHLIQEMRMSKNDLNVVILDACRTNPFTENNFTKHSRSIPKFVRALKVKKGLAQVKAPSSTLIAYATSPGEVAYDGQSRNGVYTSHLLRFLKTKGLTIETLFKRVRAEVIRETNGKQVPWEHSSLYKYDFQLAPPDKKAKIRSGF